MLETKRLLLRPWQEEDAKSLYQYAKNPNIGPAAGWHPHKDEEESRQIIKSVLSAPETYAVVLKETMEPIGSAGIIREVRGSMPKKDTEREIGYWIGEPYWGRGLIPEAVQALLKRCFQNLGCTAVWCAYYEGNEKSRRVQEKCGFIYHHTEENVECPLLGELRTEHFTRITKEAYEEQNQAEAKE